MLHGGLEDAMELDHARGHHCEVGHHVVLAEECAHRLQEVGESGLRPPVTTLLIVSTLGFACSSVHVSSNAWSHGRRTRRSRAPGRGRLSGGVGVEPRDRR